MGCNVAPWNLSAYELVYFEKVELQVNNSPLVFYHFHSLQIEGEFSFKVADEIGSRVYQLANPSYVITSQQLKLIYEPYLKELTKSIILVSSLIKNSPANSQIHKYGRKYSHFRNPHLSFIKRYLIKLRSFIYHKIF